MNIILYTNVSEKNKIGKTLQNETTISGSLRSDTSIIDPAIIIYHDNPAIFNYAYIPEFNRYYFINNIECFRTGVWRLSMHVDVLESFKTELENIDIIVADSTDNGNDYLPGSQWKTKVKDKTDIVNFPDGLLESGEFILITAGG